MLILRKLKFKIKMILTMTIEGVIFKKGYHTHSALSDEQVMSQTTLNSRIILNTFTSICPSVVSHPSTETLPLTFNPSTANMRWQQCAHLKNSTAET